MRRRRAPDRVVFQPTASQGFQRGINRIVDVVRPTLGPVPRVVAVEQVPRSRTPELLDNAALAARRILELPDRDEDVGAMYIRHMLWRLHEEVGDGTATAAVLFQSIYNSGMRYVAAGGSAPRLRQYLEAGMQVMLDEMAKMVLRPHGQTQLTQIAESLCHDVEVAKMLGEIFDIVGEYGRLEVRPGRGRSLEREYVEGMYWPGGLMSRYMLHDEIKQQTRLETAAILITDLEFADPHQLVPVLEMALGAGVSALTIVARKLSDSALALLHANRRPGVFELISVKTPGSTPDEQATAIQDLAVLTGGRPIIAAAGHSLDGVQASDLGAARIVWANLSHFGIVGGKGSARSLRTHIRDLQAAVPPSTDPKRQKQRRERIGKLMGGSATLWIGGATEAEIRTRTDIGERAADMLRGALAEGVLPGGGAALLDCRPVLEQRLSRSEDDDERAAYRILLDALEAPARTIIGNAGYDADACLAQIRTMEGGNGFDVRRGAVVSMAEVGIFDVAAAQQGAVRGAITSAALALTIDVLVHRKQRQLVVTT